MEPKLTQVFAELFGIQPERVLDGLSPSEVKGWDSMGHLTLVQTLEQTFDVAFADGELTEMENVGRIKEVLARHGVAR